MLYRVLCLPVVLNASLNALHVNQTLALCESKADKPSVSREDLPLCHYPFVLVSGGGQTPPPFPFPEICVVFKGLWTSLMNLFCSFMETWRTELNCFGRRVEAELWRWCVPSCWQQITNLNNLYSDKIKLYVMLLTCLWLYVHDGSHMIFKAQLSVKEHVLELTDKIFLLCCNAVAPFTLSQREEWGQL